MAIFCKFIGLFKKLIKKSQINPKQSVNGKLNILKLIQTTFFKNKTV